MTQFFFWKIVIIYADFKFVDADFKNALKNMRILSIFVNANFWVVFGLYITYFGSIFIKLTSTSKQHTILRVLIPVRISWQQFFGVILGPFANFECKFKKLNMFKKFTKSKIYFLPILSFSVWFLQKIQNSSPLLYSVHLSASWTCISWHSCLWVKEVHVHVRCPLGCSDFDFFSHFEVKPSISDTLRVQGFGNWQKKIFNFMHGLRKFFCKNRKMRFFGMISKFNVRSPVWQIFTIYSACFIYGILNTHIKF